MRNFFLLIAFLATLTAGAFVYINWVPHEVRICQDLVPGARSIGFTIKRGADGAFEIEFPGTIKRDEATAEVAARFIDCLREQNKAGARLVQGIDIPIKPLGELADHWKDDTDLRLILTPDIDPVLNNMRIGPAAGLKHEVIGEWCGPAEAGACVICSPATPSDTTRTVEIRLRESARTEIEKLPGGPWALKVPGQSYKPWQKRDEKDETVRVVYRCVSGS